MISAVSYDWFVNGIIPSGSDNLLPLYYPQTAIKLTFLLVNLKMDFFGLNKATAV